MVFFMIGPKFNLVELIIMQIIPYVNQIFWSEALQFDIYKIVEFNNDSHFA